MGYNTFYNINVIGASDDEKRQIHEEIAKAAFGDNHAAADVESGFEAHWYDHDENLQEIAKRHPGVVIEVSGTGESEGDIWKVRYKDGQSEEIHFEDEGEGLSPFTEILTPEEEETVFVDAYKRYLAALMAMHNAAARRIQALKERITGRERCRLRIPEYRRFDVKTISDCRTATIAYIGVDSGFVTTPYDDYIPLSGIEVEDIKRIVFALDGIVRRLEAGCLAGHYDEKNNEFIVDLPDVIHRTKLIDNIRTAVRDHFKGLADDDAPEGYPLAIGPDLRVKAVGGPADVPEGWTYDELTGIGEHDIAALADRILDGEDKNPDNAD